MTSPSTRVAGLVEVSRAGVPVEPVAEAAADDRGLRLHVEVVELERIPPRTAILGTYEVEADEHGNVLSLRRFRRYARREK